ncbi:MULTISPECIES: class I SAM-dependent methyltransferase [unclassified Jeotgalibaca]|uniref:class I SAM-dependent methyltransferase n=1 Tax=unclassified Jeotgalibaca TaxID=2621505 RepID=UPI003FD04E71
MNTSKLEKLFQILDEAVTLLQNDLDVSYVEALTETIQNLAYEGKAQQLDGLPSDETVAKLNRFYRKLHLEEESREVIRKLIQLGFIKAIKSDKIQSNHQMTPDTIAFLMAYFIDAIKQDKKEELHIHDLAVGSGNLLMVIMDYLEQRGNKVTAEAVDNDDLLVALASNSSHLQKWGEALTFTHSDSLQELLIRPSDIAVSDLPIGYYPMDNRAEKFQTAYEDGHSFAHFLLIEQHVKYLKEGGWGFFIVPKNLIESDKKGVFMKWLKGHAYLQGMLELPETLFQSEQLQKSILILQKTGNGAKQVKEVLLGTIPDIKDARKMQGFLSQFNNWAK